MVQNNDSNDNRGLASADGEKLEKESLVKVEKHHMRKEDYRLLMEKLEKETRH